MAKQPRGRRSNIDRQRRSGCHAHYWMMTSFTRFGLRSRLIFCECEREDCPATQCRAQSKVLPPMLPVATACIETWSVRVLRDARRHGSACCDTGRCVRYAMAAPAGVAALRLVIGADASTPTRTSKIMARLRAPQKHSAPETGALRERRQRRSGVHAQFWSVAFVRDSPLQVKLKCGVDVTPPAESDLLCNGNFKLTRNGRREKSTGSLAPQSAAMSVTKMPTEVVASRSLPAGTSTSDSAPISMR